MIVSASWAVLRIQVLRQDYGSVNDNDWTFGQVIPLLLLAYPILSILETLHKHAIIPAWALGSRCKFMS